MHKVVEDLTPEEIRQYYECYKKKHENEKAALSYKFQEAKNIARQAARLLYEKYQAKKVYIFGSLTEQSRFTRWSDIDLAVRGIPDRFFYKAVAEVTSLSPDFKIDLVDFEDCDDALKKNIEEEGIEL